MAAEKFNARTPARLRNAKGKRKRRALQGQDADTPGRRKCPVASGRAGRALCGLPYGPEHPMRLSRVLPLVALAAATLLAGCESQLNVDLAVSAPGGASKVVLNVTEVALKTDDNDVKTYDTNLDEPRDLLPYSHDEDYNDKDGYEDRLELLDKDNVTGDFVGVRPVFNATDSYVQLSNGTRVPITLGSQAAYASVNFSLSDDAGSDEDREEIAMTLELPFSLIKNEAGDNYTLKPVVRAVKRDNAGAISGTLPASAVTGGDCGSAAGSGVAVYVYNGSGVTPIDFYESGTTTNRDQPIASSILSYDASEDEYLFEIRYLPAGNYTVAWTCEADADEPNKQNTLRFIASKNVSVSAGSTATVSLDD